MSPLRKHPAATLGMLASTVLWSAGAAAQQAQGQEPQTPAAETPVPAPATDTPQPAPPDAAARASEAPSEAAAEAPPSAAASEGPGDVSEAPEAEVDATDAAADAELQAIEEQMLEDSVDSVIESRGVDLYGFMDFTYVNGFGNETFGPSSFAIGGFNVYLASDLGDNWHTLSEVRFTYLPHGSTAIAGGERVDTTAADYTNMDRPVRWGSTILERAWLEYKAHPLLNIRGGHWLTPYGIWNVDHGSPVIIGVREPFIVGNFLFPESQTGLQVHGVYQLPPLELGYHLTLSNGRGPIDTYQDLDENKAIGGRLFARTDSSAGTFALGISGYAGTYTDSTTTASADANGRVSFEKTITTRYDEQSLAADFKWDWGGFALQAEAIMNDQVYDDPRPPDPYILAGALQADTRRWGGYAQVGYRFDFGGIMPYAGIEYNEVGSVLRDVIAMWGGINVRPTPRVVLKAQYTDAQFKNAFLKGIDFSALEMQAAWSF